MTKPDADTKIAELRELIREANITLKDTRAARRELAEAVAEFQRDAHEWRLTLEKTYADEMRAALDEGLAGLMKFVKMAEKRLNTRLDNIMMAITKPYQTPAGPLPLDEVLRRKGRGEL